MLRWFDYQLPDVKSMESELDRLAGEGWALDWLCFGLARFRRADRRDLRYCVEPAHKLPVEREEADYLQLCADAGWEPVAETSFYRVFASRPGTHPVPLQTDPAVEFEANWDKKLRDLAWSTVSILFVWALQFALRYLSGVTRDHLWEPLLSPQYLWLIGLILCHSLICLTQFFYLLRSRRRFREAAEAGEPLPTPSRRRAKLHSLFGLKWVLLFGGLFFIYFAVGSGTQSWANTPEVTEHMAALPALRAEDVGLTPGPSHGYLSVGGTPLMKQVYALDWADGHRNLTTQWYHCPTEWLAGVVVHYLYTDFQQGRGLFPAPVAQSTVYTLAPVDLGFDQSWLASLEEGYQLLLFREGSIVAYVTAPVDFTDLAVLDAVWDRLVEVDVS